MNAAVSLLERAVTASVALDVGVPEEHPSVALLGARRHGSGVIFDPLGLVLTASYVTLGAREIEVVTVDNRRWTGRRVVQDMRAGVAVVAIEESGRFPALPLGGSRQVSVGDEVFLLAAVQDNGRRVHNGAVSAVEPFDAYWEFRLEHALFTTAPNPGFGGGALVDRHGKVVGLVLLELAAIGRFTLAAPADDLIEHREEVIYRGRTQRPPRGWLGLFCYSVGDHVVVAGVVPGSPAALAGLRGGDVVLMVNDQRIERRGALYDALWRHRPGERVQLRIYRDKEVRTLSVELGDAEEFFA